MSEEKKRKSNEEESEGKTFARLKAAIARRNPQLMEAIRQIEQQLGIPFKELLYEALEFYVPIVLGGPTIQNMLAKDYFNFRMGVLVDVKTMLQLIELIVSFLMETLFPLADYLVGKTATYLHWKQSAKERRKAYRLLIRLLKTWVKEEEAILERLLGRRDRMTVEVMDRFINPFATILRGVYGKKETT